MVGQIQTFGDFVIIGAQAAPKSTSHLADHKGRYAAPGDGRDNANHLGDKLSAHGAAFAEPGTAKAFGRDIEALSGGKERFHQQLRKGDHHLERFHQGAKKPANLLLVCGNYHLETDMLDVFEAFPADRVRFISTDDAPRLVKLFCRVQSLPVHIRRQ